MSDNPDEIRAEIERTRANLSDNVNELVDEANPKNIAKRKVNRVKEATVGVKDKIMGSASDAGHSTHSAVSDKVSSASSTVSGAASSAQSRVSDAASSVSGAVSSAPQQARRKTEGNPLAAGLVAFGAGLLISSLIPSSEREQEAARGVKENLEPVKEKVTEVAKETAGSLKEPLQDAAESVKSTAQEAAQNVKEESASAASDVKQEAQSSGERVKSSREQ